MRNPLASLVAFGLIAAFALPPALAQGDANATVCAASDEASLSPEQRMAACDALIRAARNAPKPTAEALVHRAPPPVRRKDNAGLRRPRSRDQAGSDQCVRLS